MCYRYIVLFEMQNHSAYYRSSYPQREMIRDVNPQPCCKISFPLVSNCTSIIPLQCTLKPLSIISTHFIFSQLY